ncbi:MAG: peptide ABC transporter permease [Gallionellales bacterium CG_4_10_14_3_um_filter_54_96]|nr:FtsX-like permease family protein [Gallionella sp.]PIV15011.1 MAG: peptide ABC transporter permease [Gallionellales bacterium CG03_land_8_20_14_0_80_55_15]PIV91170.1 MAG: peptide ABC transporter permease [Gallionellales bacterium CG17_big_fil_post_rev_8_21_14_2_50_54_146]PIX04019.1 MAG: peptide ABC transporter permease [Gallionellales bacterium CG_4_8_14_3_um_filter_54_18]PIY06323.1 MAG: peptide ABC transporter permease [Gallionellales bacterium CG_4_10_14_3_um_filter_54_96]PJC03954.1 MAG: 
MRFIDLLDFASTSLRGSRSRTLLMILAMSIGVAAVVVLTALGEGARRYVVNQFSSLGTNLVLVFPGRTETAGINPGMLLGQIPRELSLDDAEALLKSPAVKRIAPLTIGTSEISRAALNREVVVLGSTSELLTVRHMSLGQGQFLPAGDIHSSASVCVLGNKIKHELFGNESGIGAWVRLGDRRFRVIGVMARQGESMGFNTDEIVIVPVSSAHLLFNTSGLFRILVEAKSRDALEPAKRAAEKILMERHNNERDVTVVTQDAVLKTFDRILRALTLAVGGIAAISLAVAGVLIMNVMLIAVSQRVKEIGLLKALGAPAAEIRKLFFAEAILLSGIGSVAGLILGEIGVLAIGKLYPSLPVVAPWWAVLAALLTSLVTGVLFSVWPARRAARLDPVTALAGR